MIGSHDTFTYEKSTSWINNNCKKWWKTQSKDIFEQYKFGIRFFDIRVYRDNCCWRTCHGKVNLRTTFNTLEDICKWMYINFPEAIYRIVLEKGDTTDFLNQSKNFNKYKNLWRVDIKDSKKWMGEIFNNNKSLFDRGYKFALVNTWTYPAHELHGNINTNNFYKIDLRKEAKKINSNLEFFKNTSKLKEMINSKDELYFLDYCTNSY